MSSSTAGTRGTRQSLRIPRQRSARRSVPDKTASPAVRRLPAIALASDVVWLCVAVMLASIGASTRVGLLPGNLSDPEPTLLAAGPAMVLGCVTAIALSEGYATSVLGAGRSEFLLVFNATLVAAALVGITCYLSGFSLSRAFFVLAFVAGTSLVLFGRAVLRLVLTSMRRRGHMLHRVLLVGDHAHTREVAEVLGNKPGLGYELVGSLHGRSADGRTPAPAAARPARASHVAAAARAHRADVVFLAGGAFDSAVEMRRLAWALEHDEVQLVIAPGVTDVSRERIRVRPVGGMPLLHIEKPHSQGALGRVKRGFDLLGASALLLLLSPVMLVAALHIRVHDGGPVMFRQARAGRGGKVFRVWKFRTTVADTDKFAEPPPTGRRLEIVRATTPTDDGCVTRPGRWVRRFSIEEFPQLWNVVTGDMSLVGPRPLRTSEVAQGDHDMVRRLRVRPGMTGLWQVAGSSELPSAEATRLDLYYVDNWSMVQDLSILARTVRAVLGSPGA
jgi:exopolysaccharide biosynthesis polyprenyl glycosylphosphotransferase